MNLFEITTVKTYKLITNDIASIIASIIALMSN
ncbi:hypothetical protein Pse7429DRAFT_3408 [Pseudanabaena biceps PCC 7429]|uniref:Uncharacterized protein n=1 Tax=Pseudanabaena biceps PCC 7429 TaxID=927668 RepID=L8MY37_9CYAN|nr:hypothetical protein Pse7429DRAFT_3408 [Pseudanabaena biceps PCC 7429]